MAQLQLKQKKKQQHKIMTLQNIINSEYNSTHE